MQNNDLIPRKEAEKMIERHIEKGRNGIVVNPMQSLLQEISQIESVNGWIDVDKEPPPRDNPVFCYSVIHGRFQGLFTGNQRLFQAQYLGKELNAEFWQPLPPPPIFNKV